MTTTNGSSPRSAAPMIPFRVSQPRCKICQSEHRAQIDDMLLQGYAQSIVRVHWNDQNGSAWLTANNVSNHARKHLAGRSASGSSHARESRRARRALLFGETEPPTRWQTAETIVRTGLQAIQAGALIPQPRDILAAVKQLEEVEQNDIRELERQFRAFMKVVKDAVPQKQWADLYERYEKEVETQR